jgi:hypothetical protein
MVIAQFISDQFETRKGFHFDPLGIVVGGDYCQGSFCSSIKLIFHCCHHNGKCMKEIAHLIPYFTRLWFDDQNFLPNKPVIPTY